MASWTQGFRCFYSKQTGLNIIYFCCSARTARDYHWYAISGINCAIQGCHVSRRSKYKDIGIFKVQSDDSGFETNWRNKLVATVSRDRVVDATLRKHEVNEYLYVSNTSESTSIMFMTHVKPWYQVK